MMKFLCLTHFLVKFGDLRSPQSGISSCLYAVISLSKSGGKQLSKLLSATSKNIDRKN